MTETVRLSLDVNPKVKEMIENLKERSQSTTIVEVVRRSLALFDLCIDHVNSGGKLILQHENGEKENLRLL